MITVMADISNWLLNYSSYGLGWVASVSVLVRCESPKESQKGKKKSGFFFSVLAKNSNRNDCYAYAYAKTSLGHGLSLP